MLAMARLYFSVFRYAMPTLHMRRHATMLAALFRRYTYAMRCCRLLLRLFARIRSAACYCYGALHDMLIER